MSQFIEMFKGDNQVPLGDICNIEKGATITRNDVLPGEVPVVAGGQEPSCYHNVANREAGAITVSASGAYAGYINFWNCPIFASDCNTIISKDDEKTDQTFVYFGLRAMQKQIYGLQKGGAQPHVYGKDLQKFMFPCPSYAKQIEFSKMAKQADKSGFDGFKSQFIEMFGDFHNKVQIKDICLVVSGKSIPTKLEDIDGNNPYIKVADFNIPGNEKYITIAQRYVSDDSASYSKQIPEGSVIFAKNGAASMSNKKRLTKIRCCIDMNTMAVFPKNESILSDFLFATIEAMDVSSHVRQGAIPSISPKSIEDSYIAMPTMEEQYRYVSIAKHADKSGSVLQHMIAC